MLSKLDVNHAFQQGWQNATQIYLVLENVKLMLENNVYEPIQQFPSIAQGLVMLEGVLINMTSASLDMVSSFVSSQEPIVGEAPAVLCTDNGGVLYNKTIEDMAYITETLKSQSWVAGETLAVARMNCAGWPIKGTERYPGT